MLTLSPSRTIGPVAALGRSFRIRPGRRRVAGDVHRLAVGKLGEADSDDPVSDLHAVTNDGAYLVLNEHIDRMHAHAVVCAKGVDERAGRASADGGCRHDFRVDERIDDDSGTYKLPRPKLLILIREHRLQLDRPRRDVDQIVERLQGPRTVPRPPDSRTSTWTSAARQGA